MNNFYLLDGENYGEALKKMTSAHRVLICCGAGLSYQLTGLSWNALVLEVADKLRPELQRLDEFRADDQFELLRAHIGANSQAPLKNATLVSSCLGKLAEVSGGYPSSPEKELEKAIGQSLYRRLVSGGENMTTTLLQLQLNSLIWDLVQNGVQVRVVTTNYDTHFETSLRELLSADSDDGDGALKGEGAKSSYQLHVYSNERCRRIGNVAPGVVPFLYLHGRVPSKKAQGTVRGASSRGRIIFSESDYRRQSEVTARILKEWAGGVDVALIVGSSLNDPPLLDWLQDNRTIRKGSEKGASDVIVLQSTSRESSVERLVSEEERVFKARLKELRYNSLGVDHYIPMRCYSDISVFFRDVMMSRSLDVDNDPRFPFWTYAEIAAWGKKQSFDEPSIVVLHKHLQEINRSVLPLFLKLMPEGFNLAIRTEFWLRAAAPHAGDPFYLIKVGDSQGIVTSPDGRRCESMIRRYPGRSAALRTVQLDQASFMTLRNLGHSSTSSRWQAYYGTPVHGGLGDPEQPQSVMVGALVTAVRLDEQQHRFIDMSRREAFADAVHSLERSIVSGKMSCKTRSAYERLGVVMKTEAKSVLSSRAPLANGQSGETQPMESERSGEIRG